MGEFGIGQPVPREEDPYLVRGAGRYVDDVQAAGQARGYVLRSPHAHARIVGIDVAEAKAKPGVLLVLTGRTIPRSCGSACMRPHMPRKRRDGSGGFRVAAAISRPRTGALSRRSGRLRGGRDAGAGQGRRRGDRGRIRHAARGGRPPRTRSRPAPSPCGKAARTTRLSPTRPATRPPSRKCSAPPPMCPPSHGDQPADHELHGAARLPRRIRRA